MNTPSTPCNDCIDAYGSAWDDGLVMLHKGCHDALMTADLADRILLEQMKVLRTAAKGLHAAVNELPVEQWTDDMKVEMPWLAVVLDKTDPERKLDKGKDADLGTHKLAGINTLEELAELVTETEGFLAVSAVSPYVEKLVADQRKAERPHRYEEAGSSPAAASVAEAIQGWPCRLCGRAAGDPIHVLLEGGP